MSRRGIDGFLVVHPPNIRYLTGFQRARGALLFLPDRIYLISDPVHGREISENTQGVEVVEVELTLAQTLQKLIPKDALYRVGFEGSRITYGLHGELSQLIFGVEWVDVDGVIEQLRSCKTPDEIGSLKRAQDLSLNAYQKLLGEVTPGRREGDLAWSLEATIRGLGAEAVAFPPIVLSGPQTSYPHGRASDRTIGPEEPILIDFGAVVDGYCSDTTRMVWLDGQPEEHQVLFAELKGFLEAILPDLHPGRRGGEIDKRWRQFLLERNLADACPHALGHGVGLEVHEAPYLMRHGPHKLEAGMVVAVEPGVFFPGRYGLRIEDMAVITENGGVWLRDWEPPLTLPRINDP